MIIKFDYDKIAFHWATLKPAIEEALPPGVVRTPGLMNRVLAELLSGAMQCWLIYEGDPVRVLGVCTTKILNEDLLGVKSLLIYSLYGWEPLETFEDDYRRLAEWAKVQGCRSIVAYTANPAVLSMVRRLGGNTDFTYVSFDLGRAE